ncbi:MAG: hypothetical protein R6W75_02025 [Smithellaceae bacterium]
MINKAQDMLVLLNTAIKNNRLYPPTSAIAAASVDRLYLSFQDILQIAAPLIFSESDKNILIGGKPLEQKDQAKSHISAFKDIMLQNGVKSISFDAGVTREELASLVTILAGKSDDIQAEGGLFRMIEARGITRIHLDEKVYVAMDKERSILSGLSISDDEIARFFLLAHPDMDIHSQPLRQMAKNPGGSAVLFGITKAPVTAF